MAHHFKQHYTPDQARALLPQVRQWLAGLTDRLRQLREIDAEFAQWLAQGQDLGGQAVHRWLRLVVEVKDLLTEFARREIQIKDLDRGLVDFPALIDGREVFLCWEQGEPDIQFWHELEAGYAGRQAL
jgi:hypothetical protein